MRQIGTDDSAIYSPIIGSSRVLTPDVGRARYLTILARCSGLRSQGGTPLGRAALHVPFFSHAESSNDARPHLRSAPTTSEPTPMFFEAQAQARLHSRIAQPRRGRAPSRGARRSRRSRNSDCGSAIVHRVRITASRGPRGTRSATCPIARRAIACYKHSLKNNASRGRAESSNVHGRRRGAVPNLGVDSVRLALRARTPLRRARRPWTASRVWAPRRPVRPSIRACVDISFSMTRSMAHMHKGRSTTNRLRGRRRLTAAGPYTVDHDERP
ncbi:hypothetical protein C8Q80DRAFT_529949 [Daedaleopsis nitida]|nr:hypothetical protein C8Q80DRAFT_529949 [Daedaleopsis nitida]